MAGVNHPNGLLTTFLLCSSKPMKTEGNPFRARVRWIKLAQTFRKAGINSDSFKPLQDYRLKEFPSLWAPSKLLTTNKIGSYFVMSDPGISQKTFAQLQTVKVTWKCTPIYTKKHFIFWETKYVHSLGLGEGSQLLGHKWESKKWAEDWAGAELATSLKNLLGLLKVDVAKEFSLSVDGDIICVIQQTERLFMNLDKLYPVNSKHPEDILKVLVTEVAGYSRLKHEIENKSRLDQLQIHSLVESLLNPKIIPRSKLPSIYHSGIKPLLVKPLAVYFEKHGARKPMNLHAGGYQSTSSFVDIEELQNRCEELIRDFDNPSKTPSGQQLHDMLTIFYFVIKGASPPSKNSAEQSMLSGVREAILLYGESLDSKRDWSGPPSTAPNIKIVSDWFHSTVLKLMYGFCDFSGEPQKLVAMKGSKIIPVCVMKDYGIKDAKLAIWKHYLIHILPQGLSLQHLDKVGNPILVPNAHRATSILANEWRNTTLQQFNSLALLVTKQSHVGTHISPVLLQTTSSGPKAFFLPPFKLDNIFSARNLSSTFVCAASASMIVAVTKELNQPLTYLKVFDRTGLTAAENYVERTPILVSATPEGDEPDPAAAGIYSDIWVNLVPSLSIAVVCITSPRRLMTFNCQQGEVTKLESLDSVPAFSQYPMQVWEVKNTAFLHWVTPTEQTVLYAFKRNKLHQVAVKHLRLSVPLKNLDPSFIFVDHRKFIAVDTHFDISTNKTEYWIYRLKLVF